MRSNNDAPEEWALDDCLECGGDGFCSCKPEISVCGDPYSGIGCPLMDCTHDDPNDPNVASFIAEWNRVHGGVK